MNWSDWYTDLMDVYRVQAIQDGSLTRHERVPVLTDVPCRIYQSDNRAIQMSQEAASVRQEDRLACDVSMDIQAGDELLVRRGARLGRHGPAVRAFAADPNLYFEPFGAILPGLAHQEIRLLQQERVRGGVDDEQSSQLAAAAAAVEKGAG